MSETRRLASEYRKATGKPLAISGEIARYDAARLLDLELLKQPEGGCDAIGRGAREGRRVQVKGRAIFNEKSGAYRIGQLKLQQQWDDVVLVLMDEEFEPFEIYEADREEILDALEGDGPSSRASRGVMSVAKFKIIGRLVWTREGGVEDDDYWDNQVSS